MSGTMRPWILLLVAQDRAHGPQDLSYEGPGKSRPVRLYRALLQFPVPSFDTGLPEPNGIRKTSYESLIDRPSNRQQPKPPRDPPAGIKADHELGMDSGIGARGNMCCGGSNLPIASGSG